MRTSIFRYIVILLLCVSVWSNSYAQDNEYDIIPATPQTATMIRYGKYDTQLFTGKLNLSIPIYHIQDPDFDLPIRLIYTADAFKPRQASGYVGKDWFLQAGGCIHREIKGYADEGMYTTIVHNQGESTEFKIMGSLIYARQAPHSAADIYSMSPNIFQCYTDIGDSLWVVNNTNFEERDIEIQPDIYHFNFCGYSGSFTINNAGTPIILNGDFVEVDLNWLEEEDGLGKSEDGYACPTVSQISLRTLDGYEYIFGGNADALEYSLNLLSEEAHCESTPQNTDDADKAKINEQRPCVESWYLIRIIAPNGRVMRFTYYSDYTWDFRVNRTSSTEGAPPFTLQKTRQALLSSIQIVDTQLKVDFISNTTSQKMFTQIHYQHNKDIRLLSSVRVQCDSTILRTVNLNYETRTNHSQQNYWHYLQNVTISGTGQYTMQYENATYPYLYAPCSGLPCVLDVDLYGYESEYANLGVLKRFTFPTGGYQEFTFENHSTIGKHQYFGCIPDDDIKLFFAVDTASHFTLGGKRIKMVKTYDKNQKEVETATYEYHNCIYYDANIKTWDDDRHEMVNLGLLASPYYKFNTHVGYETVTQYITTPTATETITNKFYTGLGGGKFDLIDKLYIRPSMINYEYLAESGMPFYEPSLDRIGTLLQTTTNITDLDGVSSTLTKKYRYNSVSTSGHIQAPLSPIVNNYVDTVCLFSRTSSISSTRYLFAKPHFLEEIIEEYDVNNVTHTKRIAYNYDKKKRITQQLTEGSDGRKYFVRYTYPDNIKSLGGEGQGYSKLVQKHLIGTSVETIQGYQVSGRDYITAGTLLLYNKQYGTLQEEAKLAIKIPITDYVAIPKKSTLTESNDLNSLTYDSRYRTTCEYVFDRYFRPESIQPVGHPATTYTYTPADNGTSEFLPLQYTAYPTSKTTAGCTTHYTYYSYIGIKTITDENGITTYYHYDTHGRLTEVYRMRNNQKEVIEAYHYHIITQ